ncbi:MAG: phosphoribosyltransferase [Acidobacteriia bacterium]|nr:phosphoribosyltransferase [Terriglobia bacterium]
MIFPNRTEAGRRLALRLRDYANRKDVIVLGIPRGGVPVAFEVARMLKAPLDVLVLRKLGVPGHEELGFGAIASGGIRVLNPQIVEALRISPGDIELVTNREARELKRREQAYRGRRPALNIRGQTVIVVDDGIATGSGMRAAIDALREMKPARIVVAVPVAPPSTCDHLRSEADDLVCLETPEAFYGVGQFYFDFSQISDYEVNELLDRAAREIDEQNHSPAEVAAIEDAT